MSQQPCLPLPARSRHGRGGGGGRKRRHAGNLAHDHDSNKNESASGEASGAAGVSGRQIADLASMSAMDYLGLVHGEASRLGDVFVSSSASAQFEDPVSDDDGANGDEEEEEGEIVSKPEGLPSAKRKDVHDNGGGVASSASEAKAPTQAAPAIGGSAYAVSYLLSARTALPPPPTLAHLPASSSSCSITGSNNTGSNTSSTGSTCTSWVNTTLDNFSKLRLYLVQCSDGDIGSKGSGMRRNVPPMKDRVAWHVICLGDDEAGGNVGGYFQDDDDDDGDDKVDDNKVEDDNTKPSTTAATEEVPPRWRHNLPPGGHGPTTSLLCQMDQVMIRRILSHHVSYLLDGYYLTSNRCRWIYALLARLSKPLSGNDAALLRELLRECCVRRSNSAGDGDGGRAMETVALLNTLIVIAGVYFEQGGGVDRLFSL